MSLSITHIFHIFLFPEGQSGFGTLGAFRIEPRLQPPQIHSIRWVSVNRRARRLVYLQSKAIFSPSLPFERARTHNATHGKHYRSVLLVCSSCAGLVSAFCRRSLRTPLDQSLTVKKPSSSIFPYFLRLTAHASPRSINPAVMSLATRLDDIF